MFSIFTSGFSLKQRAAVLASSESITSFVTGSDKLLVPGKVIASNNITQGSMSLPIEASKLCGKPDVAQVSVAMNQFGTIQLDNNSRTVWSEDVHWVRAIRLSNDCHSYNIQLKLQPSQRVSNNLIKPSPPPQLILQTVRPILAGQELLLWFSEDILAMLQIAFLTPANIQGQKEYVCLRCNALYESPNPLKLHITLTCGRNPPTKLWERLFTFLSNSKSSENTSQDVFDFKLLPETSTVRQKIAMDLTTSPSPRDCLTKISHRPFLEMSSAFKPFKRETKEFNNTEIEADGSISWPLNATALVTTGNLKEDEAHIESLVSSLGKTKQGHMCVYCGKCYSRKYGLKIHIRTHTGYKPLECKYCKRPFGDPSNLNKHVRLHAEGNTPYRCDLCGKVLVRRRDLERHLKSRHLPETHPDMNLIVNSNHIEENDDTEKSHSPKDTA